MKCPKCKEEIAWLRNVASGKQDFTVTLDSMGSIDYETITEDGFAFDDRINEYWCPECDEILCESEEEAIQFLKAEVKP